MKFSQRRAIDKEAQKATEALHEHLQDVAHKIAVDQEEWLDARMKELMRPDIYEKARHDDCHEEVDEYVRRRRITVTFIPDNMRIRIDVAGEPYAEFVPQLTVDGEPVEFKPNPELN